MSLPLAVQAVAVYALALLLSRAAPPSSRRAVLTAASGLVLVLPLLAWAPRWSPPAASSAALRDAVGAVQEPSPDGRSAVAAPPSPRRPVGSILPWLWAAGFAVATTKLGADLLAVRRLRSSARDRDGDVACSDAIEVPVVVGVLDPVVLLPADARDWTPARRALVLAHERAHAEGRDNLRLLVARFAACVHWFDPLAWWATVALRDACEHRADEAAIDGGADRAAYAQVLVELARRRAPASALAMARPSGLERRVRALLEERPRAGRAGALLRAGVVAAVAIGTATAAPPPPEAKRSADLDARLEAEADRLVTTYDPDGVAILVLDARTGAVIGQVDRGGLVNRPVSPGSVLKPFTVVAALEAGVPRDQAFEDGDMASILERSSNPGAVAIASRAGRDAVGDVLRRVGLPAPEDVPVERLALGDVRVTPAQVALAWTHLAGHGAIAAPIAADARELLVAAVEGEHATGRSAAVPGRRVAGKTGTAPLVLADGTPDPERYLASFVGLVPAEDPEVVVLVSVAGPRGDEVWGGVVAAPAFRRIVEGL